MDERTRSAAPVRVAKWGMILLSVLLCGIGVLFIAVPRQSMAVIGRVLGAVLVILGGIKIVGYFSRDLYRLAFQYDRELGVLLAVLGVIVLVRPGDVLNFIFIALGVAVLADCLFKLRIALDAKKFGIGSWWGILGLAILTGLTGAVLMFLPQESETLLAVWLGATLLAEGLLNLWVAATTVKILRRRPPEEIEVDFTEKGVEAK